MTSEIVHLHVHSEYSLTDGAIRIDDLIKRCQERGHSAVALTDHSNLFGAIEFYTKATQAGLNPIIGSEVYCDASPALQQAWEQELIAKPEGSDLPAFHLVLLATSLSGYHNLVRIVSSAYFRDNTSPPKVQWDYLLENSEGLIALTSGVRGEFSYLLSTLGEDISNATTLPQTPAAEVLKQYVTQLGQGFSKDHFYVELIDNNLSQQREQLDRLAQAASWFDLPIVASSNAHYLDIEDRDAHTILLGIKNDLTLSKMRGRRKNATLHLYSDEEMLSTYKKWPEAISNQSKIAKLCQVKFEFGEYFLPEFELGESETPTQAMRRFAKEGLDERFERLIPLYGPAFDEAKQEVYRKRLEYELDVIENMGFPGYFLIVQDFIKWAKDQDIPVGPGRGSGAGSLVAYALQITDLDPIPYNLIFERFLNPERVSMPDFDIDFCQERRDEVIRYVTEKYGAQSVAQITTFGKMLAKAVIRDVGRVLEVSYSKVDRIAKLIPNEIGIKLKDALEREPAIQEEAKNDPIIDDLLNYALKLEGLCRHTSVHAAGLVISQGAMENYVPVYRDDTGQLITQFEMKMAEKVGLVKFDFLGLKTLTVIKKAVDIIRAQKKSDFDIATIPMHDIKVFKLICGADSVGIFQLESTGMQQLLLKLQPSKFEDIIALVALFRPGPLQSGMVDDFCERKHGRAEVTYVHPDLEPILSDTYGTILYQEQVQKIAAVLANYSLGEADLLRRAMGKKKPEEMAKQKVRFAAGCEENKIAKEIAEDLFEQMAKFAQYGFNKSHSAAYGLVSYQTAYLKAHYPSEFMAAIMTCDLDNTDKIIRYIKECQRMRIEVLPPDINFSDLEFTVPAAKKVRFGLAAVKGIGQAVLRPIVDERKQSGPFYDLGDFARRVPLSKVGKKTIELLTQSGALDGFGIGRQRLLQHIGDLVKYSEQHHTAQTRGQRGLFDSFGSQSKSADSMPGESWELPPPSKLPSLAKVANEVLLREQHLLGVPLSGHLLDLYAPDLGSFSRSSLGEVPRLLDKGPVPIVCWLSDSFRKTTRDGRPMTVFRLEDASGEVSPAMFDKDIDDESRPNPGPVMTVIKVIKGFEKNPPRVRLERIEELESFRLSRVTDLKLCIDLRNQADDSAFTNGKAKIALIRQLIEQYPGRAHLKIELALPTGTISLSSQKKVAITDILLEQLRRLGDVVSDLRFRCDRREPRDEVPHPSDLRSDISR